MNAATLEPNGAQGRRLCGRLDFETAAAIWAEGLAWIDAANGERVLDLAAVERTDSAGVAVLVDWTRRARGHGSTLRLRHMPEQMTAIVEVTGVAPVLDIADERP